MPARAAARFEHPNLWRLASRFGVRCADGLPQLAGSRAFRGAEGRHGAQEVDHRDLGRLRVGEAGELRRDGAAVYVLALGYDDPAGGGRREAQAHLCRWRAAERTFETKISALAAGLREGEEYELRVVSVDEWAPEQQQPPPPPPPPESD